MDEPNRVGLTDEADNYLDEMLETLKSESGGQSLIKFDLYRLAVALGIKTGKKPKPILSNTNRAFRVTEVDPAKALFYAAQAAKLEDQGEPVYSVIERLAEQGIRDFYACYKENMGKLPWDRMLV